MPSDIVYYYCHEDVFNSIIENHKLWLTLIWDLNDSSEVHWTFKKLWRQIQDRLTINATDKQRELISLINNEIKTGIYQTYMYYVICFSKNRDLLSQWRGYADDGRGFSIGIDLGKISKMYIPWFNISFDRSIEYSSLREPCVR